MFAWSFHFGSLPVSFMEYSSTQELPDVLKGKPGFMYHLPSRRDARSFFWLHLSPWTHSFQLVVIYHFFPLGQIIPQSYCVHRELSLQSSDPNSISPISPISFSLFFDHAAGRNGYTGSWLQCN